MHLQAVQYSGVASAKVCFASAKVCLASAKVCLASSYRVAGSAAFKILIIFLCAPALKRSDTTCTQEDDVTDDVAGAPASPPVSVVN